MNIKYLFMHFMFATLSRSRDTSEGFKFCFFPEIDTAVNEIRMDLAILTQNYIIYHNRKQEDLNKHMLSIYQKADGLDEMIQFYRLLLANTLKRSRLVWLENMYRSTINFLSDLLHYFEELLKMQPDKLRMEVAKFMANHRDLNYTIEIYILQDFTNYIVKGLTYKRSYKYVKTESRYFLMWQEEKVIEALSNVSEIEKLISSIDIKHTQIEMTVDDSQLVDFILEYRRLYVDDIDNDIQPGKIIPTFNEFLNAKLPNLRIKKRCTTINYNSWVDPIDKIEYFISYGHGYGLSMQDRCYYIEHLNTIMQHYQDVFLHSTVSAESEGICMLVKAQRGFNIF